MNQYCVICEEGQEERLEALLKERGFDACFPRAERHFRIQGKDLLVLKPLMKGAVLLECEAGVKRLSELLEQMEEVKVVYLELLDERSYRTIRSLMDEEGILRMSKGISENQRPVVQEGALKGWERIVWKTNRHKRLAELDIKLNGKRVLTGLEITEKR